LQEKFPLEPSILVFEIETSKSLEFEGTLELTYTLAVADPKSMKFSLIEEIDELTEIKLADLPRSPT
jgi:hypothetical protein